MSGRAGGVKVAVHDSPKAGDTLYAAAAQSSCRTSCATASIISWRPGAPHELKHQPPETERSNAQPMNVHKTMSRSCATGTTGNMQLQACCNQPMHSHSPSSSLAPCELASPSESSPSLSARASSASSSGLGRGGGDEAQEKT